VSVFAKKNVCPFVSRECVGEKCHAWMKFVTTNQITGQSEEHEACGMTQQTHLLVEMIQLLRQQQGQTQQLSGALHQQATAMQSYLQHERERSIDNMRQIDAVVVPPNGHTGR